MDYGHDVEPPFAWRSSKTFSLSRQRLSVLPFRQKVPPPPHAAEETEDCVKVGPCPCEAPCQWGLRALDAVRRGEWPDPALRLLVLPPTGMEC
jgi:hypothetical protein